MVSRIAIGRSASRALLRSATSKNGNVVFPAFCGITSSSIIDGGRCGGMEGVAYNKNHKINAVGGSTRTFITTGDDGVSISDKVKNVFKDMPSVQSDDYTKKILDTFPGAISNLDLESKVVSVLETHGFTPQNTLLATSLCCDELARQLEDDFVRVYGNNFNLGGLSGFPFAGNTGFGAMAAHIPDDGSCLIIYGPHVGIAKDGTVGKVERQGIALIDTCCGSAIAANNYLKGITEGGAQMTAKLQEFTDFQQGAVQELILPHGKRLSDAGEKRMIELPLALYDSQEMLINDIVRKGSKGLKSNGAAILGGIQINTAPDHLDYFLPKRFDYINNNGELIEDLLPSLQLNE